MARNKREQSDHKVQQDWIKEGRGKGRKEKWNPWLHLQDVPTEGRGGRLTSHLTGGRLMHVLSGFETECIYFFEWSPGMDDIWEQYPLLPLEETQAIADELGVDHPASPETGDPIVMTTDFVLVKQDANGDETHFARDFKTAHDLFSPKTRAKLEIARRYFKKREIEWAVITDHNFPRKFAANLQFLRNYQTIDGQEGVTQETVELVREVLLKRIQRGDEGFSNAALNCDKRLGLEPGTSLTVAYHLIYKRQWIVDLTSRLRTGLPLNLLSPKPNETQNENILIQLPVAV